MTNIMNSYLSHIFWRLGLLDCIGRIISSKGRFALLLHSVVKTHDQHLWQGARASISVSELRVILVWLQERFAFLQPDEFLYSDEPGVLMTFDDGFANNYLNALPLLAEFNVPAIFFVATQHVILPRNWLPATMTSARREWPIEGDIPDEIARDQYDGMSEEQLIACAAHPLITIGAHSVSHPLLTHCSTEQVYRELVHSRSYLAERTNRTVDLFAYPTGDYNREVAEVVRSVGYRAAFAVESRNVGLPALEIPRIGLYRADHSYLAAKLSGLYRRPLHSAIIQAS